MADTEIKREFLIDERSGMDKTDYSDFLMDSYKLLRDCPQYLSGDEDINSLELAHLIPDVNETVLAIYLGINDAVCNKGLVTPFLPRHGHNNVFVFDPAVFSGKDDVPSGTSDAQNILVGFEPPNQSWNPDWTYVMISDSDRTFESLWSEKGYIDMIPAKFEDFTMISDHEKSSVCIFIDPKAFEHPVNQAREYLKKARDRGEKFFDKFTIPSLLDGEADKLVPVILHQGEKLYVARTDFGPCEHCWSNICEDNESWAVVNENSAVPLDLVIAKPQVSGKFADKLVPPKGSADMTTDWFYRGTKISRKPLLAGTFAG